MKKTVTHIGRACLAGGLMALLPLAASAAPYVDPGYAGETLGTAQAVTGSGTLDSITGSLAFTTTGSERYTANPSLPALFEIDITSPDFEATTLGQPGTLEDPILYLFDSSGYGVLTNDDASPYTHAPLLDSSTLSPGLYYLGISTYGAIPRSGAGTSAANDIFPSTYDDPTDTDFTTLDGPTGPGGGSPLTTWDITDADVEEGSFTIALSGANFAPAVPETSPVALVTAGVALTGLFLRARRRRNGSA